MTGDDNTAAGWVAIPVTHEGEGVHGAAQRLNDAGYYAVILNTPRDVAILYGPRLENLATRIPFLALIGDTIRVVDRSRHDRDQNRQRQ